MLFDAAFASYSPVRSFSYASGSFILPSRSRRRVVGNPPFGPAALQQARKKVDGTSGPALLQHLLHLRLIPSSLPPSSSRSTRLATIGIGPESAGQDKQTWIGPSGNNEVTKSRFHCCSSPSQQARDLLVAYVNRPFKRKGTDRLPITPGLDQLLQPGTFLLFLDSCIPFQTTPGRHARGQTHLVSRVHGPGVTRARSI